MIDSSKLNTGKIKIENQNFFDIIDFLPDATFIIDANHKVVAWNSEVEMMTGISKDKIIGKGNKDYSLAFYDTKRPILADLLLKKEKVESNFYQNIGKEGKSIYVEAFVPKIHKSKGGYVWAKASPLTDSSGKIIGVIESVRDITDKKNVEENLKTSETRYHSLFELSPDAIALMVDNKITLANMTMVSLLGAKSANKIVGKNILDFIEITSRSYVSKKIDEMFKSGSKMPLIEERLIKLNGKTVDVEMTAAPLSNNKDKSILIIIRDISQRNKVEENMQKMYFESSIERQKMEAVMNSMGDAVFALDKDRNIILINPIAALLVGEEKNKIIGKKYNEVFKFVLEKEKTEITNFIDEVYTQGKTTSISDQTVLENKNGVFTAVSDSAAPIKDETGKVVGCVVIFRDVTKERKIDRAKSEFVSVASHQLRTPLSAIKWFLELLISGVAGQLSDEQKHYVTQVNDSNDRMIKLVNELLNASRMETGNITLKQKTVNLNSIVKEAYDELMIKVTEKKQKLILETKGKLKVNTDPILLRQIINNLVTNANRYTPPGGKITIKTYKKNSMAVFEVKDTGYGIPENQKDKLFSKFFRADNIITKQTDGTGLGLYIAKSAIETLGGKIWYESKENVGSTFYFSLPLVNS